MHTDDKLSDFVDSKLQDIELRDGPTIEIEHSNRYDTKESQFLIITTSKGQFTVVNYNENNGYYGGFDIHTRFIENKEN